MKLISRKFIKLGLITAMLSGFALLFSYAYASGGVVNITAQVLSPSGGGGGTSPLKPPATGVVLSGKAHPLSKITVLKDGQAAATTISGPDANFYISLEVRTSGNYVLSVYGEDRKGSRSSLFTFPLYVTEGAITKISGIFLSPTVSVDKSEVKRGDSLAIFGESVPNSEITISVHSAAETFVKTRTDKNGVYLYNLDTAPLEKGQHATKSKASLGGEMSSFSNAVNFAVGEKTSGVTNVCGISDMNCDGRVNLVDFSILLYWWKKPSPVADLNVSGLVDLPDFSIVLYYWTG